MEGHGSVSEIEELEEEDHHQHHEKYGGRRRTKNTIISDIEEEESVYVAVGKSETSMEALSWTLNNLATPCTYIYLIHVFPHIKLIPNPLGVGMVPRNQVSSEQVESYLAQERSKRRDLLHKYLHSCSAFKVKVETILIESDLVAKAILDLIPILQIRNLVIGANKLNLRKSRSRRGNGIADEILKNAPEGCNVKIISEGKEVNEQLMMMSPSPLAPNITPSATVTTTIQDPHQNDSVSCICFKSKFK